MHARGNTGGGGVIVGQGGVAAELFGPELAEADVHGDADRPGAEAASPVVGVDFLDEADEGVLAAVGGPLAVAKGFETDRVEAVLVSVDQLGPGAGLLTLDAEDELAVVLVGRVEAGRGAGGRGRSWHGRGLVTPGGGRGVGGMVRLAGRGEHGGRVTGGGVGR